jgi:branched-chain amino acid transport system substrate-binding protein
MRRPAHPENLVHQATSIHGKRLPLMLLGISISTQPDDYTLFKTLRIATFNGKSWTPTGDPLSTD